eukprot:scaffold4242_cov102-Skeletonema_dohrnii-CCMP3373.AAC.1
MAIHTFWRPIDVGYDSIEGYMPLRMLFVGVSAILQPRRWPDEARIGRLSALIQYRIQRCECGSEVDAYKSF